MNLANYVKRMSDRDLVKPVSIDAHISEAYELMRESGQSFLAVVREGSFVGLIDQMSLLNGIMLSPQHFNSLEAKDIMKTSIPIIDESSSLENLIDAMKSRKLKAIPFYQNGKFKYLFTQDDLLLMLEELLNEHQSLMSQAEAKGELFMANPLVQKMMKALSDVGI